MDIPMTPAERSEVPDRGSRRPRGSRHHHRPPRRPTYPRLGTPRRPIGPGHIVPAGSPRVRNEGDCGDVHSRRWRTDSTSRRRARAPCTPGRSWPNGSSPARTRRSPSSRSGVTRGFVRCVRRCASAGGHRCEDRGAGRATPSCGRSLCVRTLRAVVSRVAPGRACGTGSETAPTFGETSLARSAWETSGRGVLRLRGYARVWVGNVSHFWPITNSRILESDDRS